MANEAHHKHMGRIGGFPLMYGGGNDTYIRWEWKWLFKFIFNFFSPLARQDCARAMVKIGGHPDSDGHDFELFGQNTYKLSELVEFMYDVKWSNVQHTRTFDKRIGGIMGQKDVDFDYLNYDGKEF